MPVKLDSLSPIRRVVPYGRDPISAELEPLAQTGGRLAVTGNQWSQPIVLDDSFALPGAATFGAWMNLPTSTYSTGAFFQNQGAANITGFVVEFSSEPGGAGLRSNSGTQALATIPGQSHYLPSPFAWNADLGDWYIQPMYAAMRYGFVAAGATIVRVVYLAQVLG